MRHEFARRDIRRGTPMVTIYRAEHIGSLLRPQELLEARESHQQGKKTSEELREIEDKYILEALELQRQVGVSVYSDGEYRRAWYAGAFEESAEGIVIDPEGPVDSRWQGPGRDHRIIHRHIRSLRGAHRRRGRDRHEGGQLRRSGAPSGSAPGERGLHRERLTLESVGISAAPGVQCTP